MKIDMFGRGLLAVSGFALIAIAVAGWTLWNFHPVGSVAAGVFGIMGIFFAAIGTLE